MTTWKRTIAGLGPIMKQFNEDALSFEQMRDQVTALLKADPAHETDGEFEDIVSGIEYSDDQDELGGYLDNLYDWADDNRVWIETS